MKRMPRRCIRRRRRRGFTLTEVVLALGIAAFALATLLGSFVVGIKAGRDSIEEVEAAHIATKLLSMRRAFPLKENFKLGGGALFPLPELDRQTGADGVYKEVLLDRDGESTEDQAQASYRLNYQILPSPDVQKNFAPTVVHLILSWPAPLPLENARGKYEITTMIKLPVDE